MMADNLEDIIKLGLNKLLQAQEVNGGYESLSFFDYQNPTQSMSYYTTFNSSLILLALSEIKTPEAIKIKSKTAHFLLKQKSKHYTYNYWQRGTSEFKKHHLPDDLDDTFCALSALTKFDSRFVTGKMLADITKVLTSQEIAVGGPYKTWLIGKKAPKKWQDVDIAVNANIAYFLSLVNINLPNLNKLFNQAIKANKFVSPYYPTSFPIFYYLSRLPKLKSKPALIKCILNKRNKLGYWENPLNTALAISALLNLGYPKSKLKIGIKYLLSQQTAGIWEAYAFCFDPQIADRQHYNGSSTLTTAFCLEALHKYSKIKINQADIKPANTQAKKLYKEVITTANNRFKKLSPEIKLELSEFLQKIIKIDRDQQIVLVPYIFIKSFRKNTSKINKRFLINLCLANLYGWIAYTIYDDFLDNEGDPKKLSAANLCLRECTRIYCSLFSKNSAFNVIFRQVMDQIDAANTWEICHCTINGNNKNILINQLPDYENLNIIAQKSLGHCLGALAILFKLGNKTNSLSITQTKLFFEHYLIAKQLNDDAHDWEEDLKNRRINYVSTLILKKYQQRTGKNHINLETELPKLRELFWYEIISEVSAEITRQIGLAKRHLTKINLINYPDYFLNILDRLDNSAKLAVSKSQETIEFLQHY